MRFAEVPLSLSLRPKHYCFDHAFPIIDSRPTTRDLLLGR